MYRSLILLTLLIWGSATVTAQERQDSTIRKGFLHDYWQSLINGNVDRTMQKRFDVTFGIAPTYTHEGSFGIGGTMTGLYRMDRKNTSLPPSDIILSASASLRGFYVLEANGTNFFPDERSRLIYNVRLSRKHLDFWGIRFEECAVNPTSRYVRTQVRVEGDYIYKLWNIFSLGAGIRINYALAKDMTSPSYIDGQPDNCFLSGINGTAILDTRDSHTNPSRGVHVVLSGTIWPSLLSDTRTTNYTAGLTASAFIPVWKGGVMAADIYMKLHPEDCPWNLREEICVSPGRMRGYYIGRYIDSCQLTAQIEIRQNIYGRLGAVAWGGAGTLFPALDCFSWKNLLPNYGVGLRFEYKNDINLRADVGFGRNTWGFSFGFSEAF